MDLIHQNQMDPTGSATLLHAPYTILHTYSYLIFLRKHICIGFSLLHFDLPWFSDFSRTIKPCAEFIGVRSARTRKLSPLHCTELGLELSPQHCTGCC